jgi:hypothetical protein
LKSSTKIFPVLEFMGCESKCVERKLILRFVVLIDLWKCLFGVRTLAQSNLSLSHLAIFPQSDQGNCTPFSIPSYHLNRFFSRRIMLLQLNNQQNTIEDLVSAFQGRVCIFWPRCEDR